MLSTEPVLQKAAVGRGFSFRPSSTDVDRETTSLNALKVCYFSICFFIFGIQTVSEIVCYCTSGLEVREIACFNAKRIKRENI